MGGKSYINCGNGKDSNDEANKGFVHIFSNLELINYIRESDLNDILCFQNLNF